MPPLYHPHPLITSTPIPITHPHPHHRLLPLRLLLLGQHPGRVQGQHRRGRRGRQRRRHGGHRRSRPRHLLRHQMRLLLRTQQRSGRQRWLRGSRSPCGFVCQTRPPPGGHQRSNRVRHLGPGHPPSGHLRHAGRPHPSPRRTPRADQDPAISDVLPAHAARRLTLCSEWGRAALARGLADIHLARGEGVLCLPPGGVAVGTTRLSR